MRLLYLTAESFPTFRADVAVLFGRYLWQHGVESDVVAPLTRGAIRVEQWPAGRAFVRPIGGGAVRMRVMSVWHAVISAWRAKAEEYSAFQVRDMPVVASIVLTIARLRGRPFYYWMSYPIPEGQIALARDRGLGAGFMKFFYPWMSGHVGVFLLRHWVLPRADHVFVQSPRMRDELAIKGVSPTRMTPVLMGVDVAALKGMCLTAEKDARLGGRRVIGYLGTIDRPRQIEKLFAMMALVINEVPRALLLIVGDTEDDTHRKWLREEAVRAGVEDAVIFAGWQASERAWRLILNAEVALSPFPRGPLLDSASPTKVPEYMALGIPVVCNDNPDQSAAITQSGAGLCVPYTPADFAQAVLKLLSLSRSQRLEMGAAGKSYVEDNRDYERIARQLATTYHALEQ